MGCVVGILGCCFCSSAASLCCACLPACKSSTSTRLMYGMMLILFSIVCVIFLAEGLHTSLEKIPSLCKPNKIVDALVGKIEPFDCKRIVGYNSVYRVCFGLATFYFMMMLIMIKVETSLDPRSYIQNGFWFFKYVIVIALIVGAFYFNYPDFDRVWMIFGMIGAFAFIIIQLILLVDFAHSWNETWVDYYEETEQIGWYLALILFTVVFYAAGIVGVVFLFIFYGNHSECGLNKFLISFNLILCIASSIISILPKIQKNMPRSGLLQSSIISSYVIFITWSALTNYPYEKCNPTINSVKDAFISSRTFFGILLFLCTVAYSCVASSDNNSVGKLIMQDQENTTLNDSASHEAKKGNKRQEVWDNEEEGVAYNYSFFHFMLFLGSLYIMMTITDWYTPFQNNSSKSHASMASLWVKIVSSWLSIFLYNWSLLAPVIFPDREFS